MARASPARARVRPRLHLHRGREDEQVARDRRGPAGRGAKCGPDPLRYFLLREIRAAATATSRQTVRRALRRRPRQRPRQPLQPHATMAASTAAALSMPAAPTAACRIGQPLRSGLLRPRSRPVRAPEQYPRSLHVVDAANAFIAEAGRRKLAKDDAERRASRQFLYSRRALRCRDPAPARRARVSGRILVRIGAPMSDTRYRLDDAFWGTSRQPGRRSRPTPMWPRIGEAREEVGRGSQWKPEARRQRV